MNQQQLPRMYSLTAIGVATFLGSALAAGYMLASNYAALGQRRTAQYAMLGSIGLVLAFIFLPTQFATNIPTAIIFMIAQVLVVLAISNKLQGAMFASFEEMGGRYHSMGRAVLVGVLASLVLTAFWVLVVLAIGGVAPPPTDA